MTEKITMYGHPACPTVPPLKHMLRQAGVDFEYINIHEDYKARQRVRDINHGYESVPTLEFPDGSTLTEPSGSRLNAKLREMGYRVPFSARLVGMLPQLVMVAVVLVLVLDALGII